MRFALVAVALAACLVVSSATLGVDVSSLFDSSSWQCLRNNGYSFAIIRCYCSTGNPDHNCPQSVANAWSGGMDYVDIYMFPCPQCGDARSQVQSLHDFASDVKYGLMWLDIEGPQYWLGDYGSNQNFMNELAGAAQDIFGDKLGGIYTNANGWNSIFGDWDEWGNLPLWWAYWDYSPSFDNFSPFAGWNKPAIKQYVGDTSVCGLDVDLDAY